ncbi:hypothetical protein C8Q78DRAFT_934746, partial [Trametes maxima]
MPDPKDRKAPLFKGKDVFDFVQSLEHLARACGMEFSELPGYVLRYCSQNVRDVLVNENVLAGHDWLAAKSRLIFLYESQTLRFKATTSKFRAFAEKQKKKSMVKDRKSLDKYRNRFVKELGDLVEQSQIADKEVRIAFFRGLPKKMRDSRDPPSIDEVLEAARDYYSSDRLEEETDSDSEDSDTDDSDKVPEDNARQKTDVSRLKTGPKGTGLRFTSDLQESVSIEGLQDQILGTKVTLTLREVLAMS